MPMSAIDDIAALVDTMRARKGEMTSFEGLLSELVVILGDIESKMGQPEDHSALINALLQGLRELRISPEVHVNVPQIAAPEVNVTVQPAQVVVMAPPDKEPKGW